MTPVLEFKCVEVKQLLSLPKIKQPNMAISFSLTLNHIMNKNLCHINSASSNPTTKGRLWDMAMVILSYE